LSDLTEDPRFLTNDERFANRAALGPLLEQAFLRKEARDWVPLLLEAGVPVGEVNTLADALDDPQVRHRNMVLALENAAGDRARVAGNPVKFRGAAEPPHRYPPALGGDTRETLCGLLGLSEAEYETYRKDGIVRERT
jgi:crotonobetainyl-CoA:carnitine CoA-transferase CaiB-like acyl-CoA transferase